MSIKRQEDGPMQKISLQSGIGGTIGDFYIDNVEVYAWYQNRKVTEVPAGQSFEIHAEYDIANLNAGLTLWSTCMTIYNVTKGESVGSDLYRNHSGKGLLTAHDAVNVRMPDEATTFRVKLFANQGSLGVDPPPEREW